MVNGVRVSGFANQLRRELCARNEAFARENSFTHVLSYGAVPVIVYSPETDGRRHGNFISSSYEEMLKRPEWTRRMGKVHAQAKRALPRADRAWRELDSCTSSDALLMNVFCYRGVCRSRKVALLLGTEVTDEPQFGYKARVPLLGGKTDNTEVDLKLGRLLVEAKLTENDFQVKPAANVERYRDFKTVFDVRALPRAGDRYVSYQLIRNVLAAYAMETSFCVIADARRPDLIDAWHAIMRCVRDTEMRTRCKVLTWQELSAVLPDALRKFLTAKYGITQDREIE
jgi:hypothetical protein